MRSSEFSLLKLMIRAMQDRSVATDIAKIESLVAKICAVATQEVGTKEAIAKLLESARRLIELAEEISENRPEKIRIAIPFEAPTSSGHSVEVEDTRIQEAHINPVIQERFSDIFYKIRRARDRAFPEAELFGDPAWDILLDLVKAERDHKSISVTSACMAASVPPTTALRWVTVLEDRGYIERSQDPLDGRRRYVSLSEKGRTAMNKFFAEVIRRELIW